MNKLRKKLKKNQKGFTLVELIVVIAILGILAFLAVPRVIGSLENAQRTAHNANVRTLESAAALYVAEKGGETTWNESDFDDEYIQKWPEPTEKYGPYTVTINGNGTIEVKPEADNDN